jgi:hypothetical protein
MTLARSLSILCVISLASVAGATTGRVRFDVTGEYSSNWDDVILEQAGSRLHGKYVCCGGGTIEGKISDNGTIRYKWASPSGGGGMGVWTIDGDKLLGTWGWKQDDDDGGRWDLERKPALAN